MACLKKFELIHVPTTYDGRYLDGTTEGASVLNGEGAVTGDPHHEIQEL
jgi:hypothetical protein